MIPRAMPNCTAIAPRLRLATAAALVVALGWGGSAGAAAHGKPGHHCACAERCKGAACCCPSDAHEPADAPASPAKVDGPSAPAPKPSDAPCARSAPCGTPDLPAPASSRPVGRMAALLTVPAPSPVPSSRLQATSGTPRLPAGFVSRLDDPPEA
ncbi:MAG TPA: hypothetical protein VGH33_14955 [Isosphaeraceae bacterium]